MTDLVQELREFYEKLYFHEIEARERIGSRLQMALTLIAALFGAFAFLVQAYDREAQTLEANVLRALLVLSAALLLAGTYYFVRALHNHTYSFLPTSGETEKYRKGLERSYPGPDGAASVENAMRSFVYDYLVAAAVATPRCRR